MQLLMLSHDPQTLTAFRRSCGEMGIRLQVCEEADCARCALAGRRFDAVIIDCDDTHSATSVLKSIRSERANRAAVVLAILNGETHGADAIDMGANLVLSKPVSCDRARQELRRVGTLVGDDQRQHPRFEAKGSAYVSCGHTIDRRAEIVNIAVGGMALRLHEAITEDDILRLRFQLPGTNATILARAEIAWSDPHGLIGVRFVGLPQSARAELEKWLQARSACALT